MSSWSAEILDSDDALDWQGMLLDVAGIDADAYLDAGGSSAWREQVTQMLPHLLDFIDNETRFDGEARGTAMLVLGTLVLGTGAPLPDELREQVIGAAEADSRAQDDDVRERVMARFIAQVQVYPAAGGEPVSLSENDRSVREAPAGR